MDINYERIGQKIRLLRTEQGLSQEELAEYANVSRVFISNVERGKNTISLETAFAIAAALKSTIGDVLNDGAPLQDFSSCDPLYLLCDCSKDEIDFLLELLKSQRTILRYYHITK